MDIDQQTHNLGIGLTCIGLWCGARKGRKPKRLTYNTAQHILAAQMSVAVKIETRRHYVRLSCFWCGKLSPSVKQPDDCYECSACRRLITMRVNRLSKAREKQRASEAGQQARQSLGTGGPAKSE